MDMTGYFIDQGMGYLYDFPSLEFFTEEKAMNRAYVSLSHTSEPVMFWKNFPYKVWPKQIQEQYKKVSKQKFNQITNEKR